MDEVGQNGSRNPDGNVPNVNWNADNGKVNVNWHNPDNAYGNLRSRQEVSVNNPAKRDYLFCIFYPAVDHF